MTALCSGKICTIFPEKGALNFWKACTIALEYSCIDSFSMERAIFNIIDNAIEYKTEKDRILCNIMQEKDLYTITISNKYGKFNDEVLENATKLFYTSNKHRNTAHYGIGLAYVNRVIKANQCYLYLFNSNELGATVKIQVPIQ